MFTAGLMIGRTPEYLGKQLTVIEMKLIALYAVVAPLVVLRLTALALATDAGLAGLTTNKGPHGLSEILVAYTTSMTNNGQNFAGLSANTPFYNITTALAMMAGRFGHGIPALALTGQFAQQRRKPATLGTLPHRHPTRCGTRHRDRPRRRRAQLLVGAGARANRRATRPAVEEFASFAGPTWAVTSPPGMCDPSPARLVVTRYTRL